MSGIDRGDMSKYKAGLRLKEVNGAPDNRITAKRQVLTPRYIDLKTDIGTGDHNPANCHFREQLTMLFL